MSETCDYCSQDHATTRTAFFKYAKRYACLCRSCWNVAVRWESDQIKNEKKRAVYLKLATWTA